MGILLGLLGTVSVLNLVIVGGVVRKHLLAAKSKGNRHLFSSHDSGYIVPKTIMIRNRIKS